MRKCIAVLAVLAAGLLPAAALAATPPKPVATFLTSPVNPLVGDPITSTPGGSCAAAPCLYTWVIKYTVKDALNRSSSVSKTITETTPAPPPPTTTVTTPPPPPTTTTTTATTPPPPPPPTGDCASSANTPGGADPFGTCFPGPTNTGVPSPVVLSPYTGPCTITTPNTVIDSKTVNCALTVQAGGLVVKNSKVNGNIWLDQDVSGSSGWSMSITDSEVDAGAQNNYPAICCGMYTVTRVNAHGGLNGGDCEFNNQYCTITDSYYHDPYQPASGPTHLGGFRVGGGTNITLTHNTIWCNAPVNSSGGGCTGDINLLPVPGSPIDGALVKDNLMPAAPGASFCTYTGDYNGPANHVTYDGNVFQRGANRKCATYGAVSDWGGNNPTNVWKPNNLWDDGVAVNPLTD